jgi:hypothetical protein
MRPVKKSEFLAEAESGCGGKVILRRSDSRWAWNCHNFRQRAVVLSPFSAYIIGQILQPRSSGEKGEQPFSILLRQD